MALVAGLAVMTLTRVVDDSTSRIAQIGDASVAFVETKDLDGGDARASKEWHEMLVECTNYLSLAGVTLTLKYRDDKSKALISLPPVNLVDADPHKLRTPQAKYWRFRFQDTGSTIQWKFSKFILNGSFGSRRV